ncbi:MAG: hypothetical protein ABI867_05900 [Kofleriaceae bacterium]
MTRLTLALCLTLTACASKPSMQTTPPGGTKATGTLTGTVAFVGTPCPEPKGPPCDGVYPNYEVVVLDAQGKEAGKATTQADGTFSLDLPAGKYVIETPAGPAATAKQRTEVEVARDAMAKVELKIDTGVR